MYNTKIMNRLHLTFLFIIISLTFLIWISHRGNEVGIHNIYLNMNFLNGNTWKIRNDRLLTNDDAKSEIGQNDPSNNITLAGEKNNLKDTTGSSEIHERVKMDTENSMHAYIKKLEHGYPNKKGLKRLDCHYEKKLFNEMYKLDKIAGHMKSKNSYFKKVILKRYGLRFVIFSLVILLGITASIVCYMNNTARSSTKPCKTDGEGFCNNCTFIGNVLNPLNTIIHISFIIILLSSIIYVLCKIKKYKRIKKKKDTITYE